MTLATAFSESSNTFELAALRLLLCAQAAIDPFVAVLLALGSMELLLQSLGEQLEVSQLEIEH